MSAERAAQSPPPAVTSTQTNVVALIALVLVIVLGIALIAVWLLGEFRARREEPEAPQVVAGTHTAVLGYVALKPEDDAHERIDAATRAIGVWCERRGWQLERVIHDMDRTGRRPGERPGFAHVLDKIRAGEARGIVVQRLGEVTHSAREIGPLLQWLGEADAFLVALDYALDTSQHTGQVAARALIDVSEWESRRIAVRTQNGLDAAAVRNDPELHEQILAMREAGMSLQAIADTLNAAGVPTRRGGTHWRPSSVQAATGYKRPGKEP